jgi:hypothetical protein
MSIETAIKCFEENLRLFGDSRTQPEKFNLYNGLAQLSKAVQSMEVELHRVRSEVESLRRGR